MEELPVGTRVEHPRYGEGIISKNKLTAYEIFFEKGGKIEITKRNTDLSVIEKNEDAAPPAGITHPLKVLKFCPKCGSPAFVVSGERSMKCLDCSFHFFINSAAAIAALVADKDGKLLLTTRGVEPGYGKLDLPGGFIDPGETAENAVRRELTEELGMKLKSMHYLCSSPNEYIFSAYSVFTLDMAFRVIPESVSGLKPMDDILDFKFYAEKEIDFSRIPAPSILQFVKEFFKK